MIERWFFFRFLAAGEAGDLRGRRVLEFGAGTGFLSLVAVRLGASALATDANPRGVRAARGQPWKCSRWFDSFQQHLR